ncbi:CPBP family intramembrane metalloprotease (plasmid) [Clostridium estertheticum]|uniref:CPBP family intramembrane glutamic endopeptidase n=1 Tax=Clostridium estertheticum TaxID=238834 RepID=UPI001C7DAA14|nr:type II CAAX endopeptidase family protein [Clostridium estertheticum]MBX4262222.1 CPBP family intramembrane metalloprotease [Clostridium estertheticum]WLC72905.1 CPBP family intramembrane metalloprotease [Clostridium estertheticum]
MKATEEQIIIAYGFRLIVLCIYLSIVIFGKKSARLKIFRNNMLSGFKAPLVIALISYFGYFIGTLNPKDLLGISSAVEIFCMSSFGITVAKSIKGFDPLPVSSSIINRNKVVKKILLTVIFSLSIVLVNIFVSNFSFSLCASIFHESDKTAQAMQMIPGANKWLSFFVLLSGAGIFEEGMFRLFLLTFFWKITKRPWLSLVISSLCFGLYHLTPLNQMYQVYWQFPVAQVVSVFLSGLIFGFFYIKRGFETSVLGHTLCDWIGVVFFMK